MQLQVNNKKRYLPWSPSDIQLNTNNDDDDDENRKKNYSVNIHNNCTNLPEKGKLSREKVEHKWS